MEALENLTKKIRSKGYTRLTEEEKKALLEAEPQVVKQVDWKEHVGIGDNIQIVKILDVVYGLMSTLDHVVIAYNFLVHLLLVENTLHTTLFLCISTFAIMWYEWAIPLAMIAAGIKLLHINYSHKKYALPPPNV
jgi:hypothetical protein